MLLEKAIVLLGADSLADLVHDLMLELVFLVFPRLGQELFEFINDWYESL